MAATVNSEGGVVVSGENRRPGAWLLPAIVVAVGAYVLYTGVQNGTLSAVALKPVNWVGVPLLAAGAITALGKKPLAKLLGVLVAVVGAILVICV